MWWSNADGPLAAAPMCLLSRATATSSDMLMMLEPQPWSHT